MFNCKFDWFVNIIRYVDIEIWYVDIENNDGMVCQNNNGMLIWHVNTIMVCR